jgi:hypothetical protein
MKKLLLFSLLILLVSATVSAQDSPAQKTRTDFGEFCQKHLKKISSMDCRIICSGQEQEWTDLSRSLHKEKYEEWFSVRQGKGRVQLLSRDGSDGSLEEVACLIVGSDGDGLYFHLKGHFTAADKARMESAFSQSTQTP